MLKLSITIDILPTQSTARWQRLQCQHVCMYVYIYEIPLNFDYIPSIFQLTAETVNNGAQTIRHEHTRALTQSHTQPKYLSRLK